MKMLMMKRKRPMMSQGLDLVRRLQEELQDSPQNNQKLHALPAPVNCKKLLVLSQKHLLHHKPSQPRLAEEVVSRRRVIMQQLAEVTLGAMVVTVALRRFRFRSANRLS